MPKLSTNSKTDILTHLGILVATGLVLFFAFFFLYLPWTTNHGEELEVPDLRGLSILEAESALSARDLIYEVSDSTFVLGHKALSVFSHYPKPESSVKKGRKIYLTIITDKAPKVDVPNVIGRSESSAKNLISSIGLVSGQSEFIPAIEKNTVLRMKHNGGELRAGESLTKGSEIILVVGDGFGNTSVAVPDLVGMTYDEADIVISGSSLNLGSILYSSSSDLPVGTVVRQRPASGVNLKTGDAVNIWLSGESEVNQGN